MSKILFIDIHKDNIYEPIQFINYNTNNIIDDIIPNKLYIGNSNSNNIFYLQKHNITHVVCVEELPPIKYPNIYYTHISINEKNPPTLTELFNNVFEMIEKSETTLIYCYKGVSRSATFICAYLMKKYNLTYTSALIFLKNRRTYVDINISLINELIDYEYYLHDK